MMLFPLPPVLEIPLPNEKEVAFAAFAPLPKPFGEKDRQRLGVAIHVLEDGSQEYGRRTIYNLTDGRSVNVALLPDGVVIRFIVSKDNISNGIALMEGLLRRPVIDENSLKRALERIQRREPNYWAAALRPLRNDLKTLKPDEARTLLLRVFDLKKVVVSVAGGFPAGEPELLWESHLKDWKPFEAPRYPDISPTPEPKDNPSGITTVELRGQPVPAGDPSLPAKWLAMIALGVGKGSSLFQNVRQVEGWSYRQEAILWPDPAGLVPRLVAATAPEEGQETRAEALRATLVKAVETWTETDRQRALGMAEITLNQGIPLGPLWLSEGPPSNDLYDRALLDAYWFAKTNTRWDAGLLLAEMRAITLEEIKSSAQGLLKDSRAIVLPGR